MENMNASRLTCNKDYSAMHDRLYTLSPKELTQEEENTDFCKCVKKSLPFL